MGRDQLMQWVVSWVERNVPDQATRDRFGRELVEVAALPTPSGGEKAECTCETMFHGTSWVVYNPDCRLHAPKPAAEKP